MSGGQAIERYRLQSHLQTQAIFGQSLQSSGSSMLVDSVRVTTWSRQTVWLNFIHSREDRNAEQDLDCAFVQ